MPQMLNGILYRQLSGVLGRLSFLQVIFVLSVLDLLSLAFVGRGGRLYHVEACVPCQPESVSMAEAAGKHAVNETLLDLRG